QDLEQYFQYAEARQTKAGLTAHKIMSAIVKQTHHRRRREAADWLCRHYEGRAAALDKRQTQLLAAKAPPDRAPVGEPQPASKARTVRFRCPGGETPSVVRTGCVCGSGISNPCETGGTFPTLLGNVCVFECVAKPREW